MPAVRGLHGPRKPWESHGKNHVLCRARSPESDGLDRWNWTDLTAHCGRRQKRNKKKMWEELVFDDDRIHSRAVAVVPLLSVFSLQLCVSVSCVPLALALERVLSETRLLWSLECTFALYPVTRARARRENCSPCRTRLPVQEEHRSPVLVQY